MSPSAIGLPGKERSPRGRMTIVQLINTLFIK